MNQESVKKSIKMSGEHERRQKKMGDKKILNENEIEQVNGGTVFELEEIINDELENERHRRELEKKG